MLSQKAPTVTVPGKACRTAIERLRKRPMRGLPVIYAKVVRNVERANDISNEAKADILAPWRKVKR